MIVRKTLDIRIIIAIAWRRMSMLAGISTVVCVSYYYYGNQAVAIDSLPASIMGVALSILIGFRVNSAYERWWEARKIWGALVNDSRSITRQVLTFVRDYKSDNTRKDELWQEKKKFVYRQIAFVYALSKHLRKQEVLPEIKPFVTDEEMLFVKNQKNIPNALLYLHGLQLEQKLTNGYLDDFRHMQIDYKISALTDSLGACERIKNTIFPRQYSVYTTIFIAIYTYLLPLILVPTCGWYTIPLALIIGFLFFALDSIARGIENPFENTFNDIPMSNICRTIEINLKQMLNEQEIPQPTEPVNGFLY
jgi:ion channel-forming bestrophin family protein